MSFTIPGFLGQTIRNLANQLICNSFLSRDELKPATPGKPEAPGKGIQDQLSYYVQLAQQQQQQQQQMNTATTQAQVVQTASSGGVQTITVGNNQQQVQFKYNDKSVCAPRDT